MSPAGCGIQGAYVALTDEAIAKIRNMIRSGELPPAPGCRPSSNSPPRSGCPAAGYGKRSRRWSRPGCSTFAGATAPTSPAWRRSCCWKGSASRSSCCATTRCWRSWRSGDCSSRRPPAWPRCACPTRHSRSSADPRRHARRRRRPREAHPVRHRLPPDRDRRDRQRDAHLAAGRTVGPHRPGPGLARNHRGQRRTRHVDEHQAIYHALRSRDQLLAQASALVHVNTSESWLRTVLAEQATTDPA